MEYLQRPFTQHLCSERIGGWLPVLMTKELSDSDINRIFRDLISIEQQDCQDLFQFRSLVSANQYRRLYRTTRRYVAVGSKVLDWGCGNGHFSYALCRLGYEVSGFSFDDFCLRKHLSEAYEFDRGTPDSPTALPYPDNNFDAVFSVGVLEHVRETGGNELASLREIFRILKPGGCFVCYHFPNRFSLIEAISATIPEKHHHRYRYTGHSINELCRQTGFELLRMQRYGALPRNMWNSFPQFIRNSQLVTSAWNFIDQSMSYPLSFLCQNYLFVAIKPSVDPIS